MNLQSKFSSVSFLVFLTLVVYQVQALAPPFDLEPRADAAKPAPNAPKKPSGIFKPPDFYQYRTMEVSGSDLMRLRYEPEFIWSGAFEFSELKRISKSGKKSHNILKPGVQKCLTVRDKNTENGDVIVDACACTTGPCNKDNNINSPTPRFQWNIRGRLVFPEIYGNGVLDVANVPKGEFGEKQLPYWYGSIKSALNEKCLEYIPPKRNPPPFTEQGTPGKIGDVVVKECNTETIPDPSDREGPRIPSPGALAQLWLIWVFKKDALTRILPIEHTHHWQTCAPKGSSKNSRFRGLIFNTDSNSEDKVYFGCHFGDNTAINPHPWYFRVSDADSADLSQKELDSFAREHLQDFA
ncbi:hypothetical protein TWF506_002272 [Arthrobotrys conoides]|uniref:Uncharacterized protein n=1 Tax=Arthrobotrys conoides TaxID=74498 RepID=A0AAN8NCS4_9PEZI